MMRLLKLGRSWLHKGGAISVDAETREAALSVLGAFRRMLACKAAIDAVLAQPELGHGLVAYCWGCLEWPSLDVSGAAMEALGSLLHLRGDIVDVSQEQMTKRLVLDPPSRCRLLATTCEMHLRCGTGALLLSHILEGFCFVLCVPHAETTLPGQFDPMLTLLASLGRPFFKFFSHPCLRVAKAAGLLMAALVEEGNKEMVTTVRHDALCEGALLEQLHDALFLKGTDARNAFVRQLSQRLVGLWATAHPPSSDMLMRCMPAPLLRSLSQTGAPPVPSADAEASDQLTRRRSASGPAPVKAAWWQVGAKERKKVRSEAFEPRKRNLRPEEGPSLNWPMLWYAAWEDHTRPDLLWNQRTREELRESLSSEVKSLRRAQQLAASNTIEWNHLEFEVPYPSLESELKIGEVYLRLLLDGSPKTLEIHTPGRFFNELYHRLLWEERREIRLLCMQGMAVTYQTYHATIGPFPDTSHVILLLSRTLDRLVRDRLLLLVRALLASTANAKKFITGGGLQMLLSLLTTVHMESERSAHSQVLQSNLLTSKAEAEAASKEWYVRPIPVKAEGEVEGDGAPDGEEPPPAHHGPFDADELKKWLYKNGGLPPFVGFECWAKGMGEFDARSSWKPPREVPHVTWACMAEGTTLLSYTQLGVLVLDLFLGLSKMHPTRTPNGALIHPMPTPKKVLSHPDRLRHIVQLLLTMEPSIVERAANLLTILVEDNPTLPRLYLTGAFFFALMYTGSNVLPIIHFLRVAHLNQLYRDEEDKDAVGGISGRSYLTLILPQAMVCCLETHGTDKFAEVFLGDFDTPEYIWNHEMRRFMIERLALHVGDLPVQLQAHCTAVYEHSPLPRILYPELKEELFCHRYYLRHLCDETRFAEWPIDEPVPLLQAILSAWQAELKKVPSSMSRSEALQVLAIKQEDLVGKTSEQIEPYLRRAYHKLAAKYHPDKNPDPSAREIFEKVQKAYEFMASERGHGGPDMHNVSLMLRGQGILYRRCTEELHPLKYSGYPLLLKVITTVDEEGEPLPALFSPENEALLLPAAKLLHLTIDVAPLNAHELQRVGGVEALVALLRRCVSMLTATSDEKALPYLVVMPLIKTLAAIAVSPECTERLGNEENAPALDDVVRCLHLTQLPNLSETALEAVAALCCHPPCQERLAQAGAAWFAFSMLTSYDFTLDEAVKEGVEASAETNAQLVANERARKAAFTLRRLGGYPSAQTAKHDGVQKAAYFVLTQYLSELLGADETDEAIPKLLRLLNSASETPYLIWNGSLRAELLEFVTTRLQASYKEPGSAPLEDAVALVYDGLKPELKVGSIYVRVYAEHPTYPLHDAPQFCTALLDYLGEAKAAEAAAAGGAAAPAAEPAEEGAPEAAPPKPPPS